MEQTSPAVHGHGTPQRGASHRHLEQLLHGAAASEETGQVEGGPSRAGCGLRCGDRRGGREWFPVRDSGNGAFSSPTRAVDAQGAASVGPRLEEQLDFRTVALFGTTQERRLERVRLHERSEADDKNKRFQMPVNEVIINGDKYQRSLLVEN